MKTVKVISFCLALLVVFYAKYHLGLGYFGVYPTNALIGKIKRGIQEVY